MEDRLMTELSGALRRLIQTRYSLPMGGLPMGEFMMLQRIQRWQEERPEAKGIYVSELNQCAYVSQPAVSRMLRRLEEEGLLERKTDPQDRRTTYVVLTEEGRSLLTACQRQMTELAGRVVDRLGAEELQALVDQLDRLTQAVQEEGQKMSVE